MMLLRRFIVIVSSSTSSIDIDDLDLGIDCISHLNPEFSAIGSVTHGKPPSHVLFDDGFCHEQADSGSLLWTLGSKVRVEYLVNDFLGDASGIVGNGYESKAVFSANSDRHLG